MLMFIFSVDINILLVPCNSHHSIYNDPSARTQGTEGAPPSAASCWTEDWNQVPWKYLHTGIIFTPGNIHLAPCEAQEATRLATWCLTRAGGDLRCRLRGK